MLLIIAILLVLILFWFCYICDKELPWLTRPKNDVWITYDKSGTIAGYVYKVIVYKNNDYRVYDHDKLIASGKIKEDLKHAVRDMLKHKSKKPEYEITDNLYMTVTINNKQIHVYNYDNTTKLIHILDNLIKPDS